MKMKDMCKSERPREKMLSLGAGALSNGELLAVLLRSGTSACGVMEMSQMLLSRADGRLTRMFSMGAEELLGLPGVGPEKAATIMAAFDLGKRFLLEESDVAKVPVVGARSVYDRMIPLMKGLRREECWAVFLNSSNYVLGKLLISTGTLSETLMDARMVVKPALEKNAGGVVLVHNHPSQNPRPSPQDVTVTGRIRAACSQFGISLVDHVIVCDSCFYSFADDRSYKAY